MTVTTSAFFVNCMVLKTLPLLRHPLLNNFLSPSQSLLGLPSSSGLASSSGTELVERVNKSFLIKDILSGGAAAAGSTNQTRVHLPSITGLPQLNYKGM